MDISKHPWPAPSPIIEGEALIFERGSQAVDLDRALTLLEEEVGTPSIRNQKLGEGLLGLAMKSSDGLSSAVFARIARHHTYHN